MNEFIQYINAHPVRIVISTIVAIVAGVWLYFVTGLLLLALAAVFSIFFLVESMIKEGVPARADIDRAAMLVFAVVGFVSVLVMT